MRQSFTIPGKLPGMNEIIGSMSQKIYETGKRRVYQYTRDKKHFTGKVMACIYQKRMKWVGRANVSVLFREKRIARDPDNIIAGIKFILDGMVAAGILDNDTKKEIAGLSFRFEDGAEKNEIQVLIEGG